MKSPSKTAVSQHMEESATHPLPATRPVDATSFVCLVGSSAGGLSAMTKLFASVSYDHMSFVVLQHLPLDHKSELVNILKKKTNLRVEMVKDDAVPCINTIHVIPADSYLTFAEDKMFLHKRSIDNRALTTIDMCLGSLASQFQHRAVAVILSGTGNDGTQGLQAIREHGGFGFVQAPEDAEYASMPQSAMDKVNIEFCLPAKAIAQKLAHLKDLSEAQKMPKNASGADVGFDQLAELVLEKCRLDLREYKTNTLERRLARRMEICGVKTIAEYIEVFKKTEGEAQLLTEEMFINVTRFFRDGAVFQHLEHDTFRRLVRENVSPEGIRVWSLGCSTGEEAYSLAITLELAMEHEKKTIPFKIIASDIDTKAIAIARKGMYSRAIVPDVRPEVLERFFSSRNGGLQVNAEVRKNILFSNHDILSDPPFSNIEFISCRNLLIYLRAPAQHRCFGLMNYALRKQGTLLLGNSESIGDAAKLFVKDRRDFNIYRKCEVPKRTSMVLPSFRQGVSSEMPAVKERVNLRDIRRDVDARILKKFGEPGVIVNSNLDVLEVRGDLSQYLGLHSGLASFSLLRFAPMGMHKFLIDVVQTASMDSYGFSQVRAECLIDETLRDVRLQALVVSKDLQENSLVLVIFSDAEKPDKDTLDFSNLSGEACFDVPNTRYVAALEKDLHEYKERLEQAIDDREISLEEINYVGQEAKASHEELQSFVEELETSREEIQSSNEELLVVNQEFRDRMSELEEARDEVNNILQYGDTCIVAVNADFCIHRFSSSAANLFFLNAMSCGRSMAYLHRFLAGCDLHELASKAIYHKQRVICKVKHVDGFILELNVQPLASSNNEEQAGFLLIFGILGPSAGEDRHQSNIALQRNLEKNWLFSSYGVAILTKDLVGVWANLEFYRLIQERRETFVSHSLFSSKMSAVFDAEFCHKLSRFAQSDAASLDEIGLQSFGPPSPRLHVINVDKIGRAEGLKDLLRVTFEEKLHE